MRHEKVFLYSEAITAAMKIINMRMEISRLKKEIREVLTYEELVEGEYRSEFVMQAFELAKSSDVGVFEALYVKSECVHGSARVSLHQPVGNLTNCAIHKVIQEAQVTR